MKQFEVWWDELPEPAGWRLVRRIASEVGLGEEEGLPKFWVANCDSLRMAPRTSLTKRAGRLAQAREAEVKRAMGAALGWRELTDLE